MYPAKYSGIKRLLMMKAMSGGGKTETYTGEIVTFSTSKIKRIKSLSVSMQPIQAGTGNPSPENVRTITGHTGATIYHSGADTINPTEYPATFTEAIYNGEVNIISGVTKSDMKLITLNGNAGWQSVGSKFYVTISDSAYTYRPTQTQISNMYLFDKQGYGGSAKVTENKKFYLQSDSGFERIWIYDTDYTFDAFKALLNNTPLQITIPIVVQTSQITGRTITANIGTNTIWADSGVVTVKV
jgi:hypothetical protein